MSENTAEIGVKDWVGSTYNHWLKHFEGNSHQAAEQVFRHLDHMGKKDLSSMRDAVDELKKVAGDKVFYHFVEDGLSPVSINNSLQKRFLAIARHRLDEK